MNNLYIENELLSLAEDLSQAEYARDVDRLDQLIADDYLGIGDNGECFDKATLLQRFRDPALHFEKHKLDKLQCRVYNHAGIVTGTVKLMGEYAGVGFAGLYAFTDVWAQRNNKWQVVSSQMTKIGKS